MRDFLYGLIRKLLPSSNVDVRQLPNGDLEARVVYSEMDWELALNGGLVDFARGVRDDLVPRARGRRRRLHWGRCRPSSGVLRLEQRGRFGTPSECLRSNGDYEWVNNKLGAP